MRKAKENKLKKYWYKLFEKELRVYKHKDDDNHKTMVNLISVFLRVDPEEPLDKKNTLYPFSLIFPNKERTFYLLSSEERDKWMEQIKKAIGYESLVDFYEVKDAIGKGKFGTVKLGIHKKTGKKVAILVDGGFEQVELIKPRKALDKIGAQTCYVNFAARVAQPGSDRRFFPSITALFGNKRYHA